ncbi:response regulator [Pseudonocardia saturnea]
MAADGAGAISAARDLRPDVVLVDVQLPDLDGFGVAEALAREPWVPAVVLVSSRSRGDYGLRVADSTARGFITKAELSGGELRRVLGNGTRTRHDATGDRRSPGRGGRRPGRRDRRRGRAALRRLRGARGAARADPGAEPGRRLVVHRGRTHGVVAAPGQPDRAR